MLEISRAAMRWRVRTTDFPTILRRCRTCPAAVCRTQGLFRVNANRKLLDVWLLARCQVCGQTVKLTVLDRATVRSIDAETASAVSDSPTAPISGRRRASGRRGSCSVTSCPRLVGTRSAS